MRRSPMGAVGLGGALLLILVWALVVGLSRALARRTGEHRWPVVLGLATCLMATVPELICRLAENLVLATILAGALAGVGWLALRRFAPLGTGGGPVARSGDEAQGAGSVTPRRSVDQGSVARSGDEPRRALLNAHPIALAVAGLGLFLAAWSALDGHFFDEKGAHFGFVSSLAQGLAPLEHPLFPGQPLRYHFGYDVLAAEVLAFTRLEVEAALDVVTVASYVLLLLSADSAGAALGGRAGASLMVILLPLGSSFLQRLTTSTGQLSLHWSAIPPSWSEAVVPPVIANFFQHPQGLGMAVSLGCLLLFEGMAGDPPASVAGLPTDQMATRDVGVGAPIQSPGPWPQRGRVALGAIYLGLLSAVHIVFFAALGFGAAVALMWRALRPATVIAWRGEQAGRPGSSTVRRSRVHPATVIAWRALAFEAALLFGTLLLAMFLGGFLLPGASVGGLMIFGKPYFDEPILPRLLHHLVAFGLPLAALPFILFRFIKQPTFLRLALLAATLFCFLIPNLMSYERSWDIVKFFTAGAFFLNALFADALISLLGSRPARLRSLALMLVLVLSTATSAWWLLRRSLFNGRFGLTRMEDYGPTSPAARALHERLAPFARPRDRVLTSRRALSEVGFLLPGWDWRDGNAQGLAIDRARADRLLEHRQRALRDLDAADLEALHIRWIVLDQNDVARLSPEGRRALEDPNRFARMFDLDAGGERWTCYCVQPSCGISGSGSPRGRTAS